METVYEIGDYSITKDGAEYRVWHTPSVTTMSSHNNRMSAQAALKRYRKGDARREEQKTA